MGGPGAELVMDGRQRIVVGTVYPLAMVALAVVPWLITAGDLPNRIADHFDLGGRADGATSVVGQVVFLALMVGLPALALAWMARTHHHDRALGAPVMAFIGVLGGLIWLFTALANRGHADWHDVRLGWGGLVGPLLGALGATLPITLLVRHGQAVRPAPAPPALALGADERAAWFGRTRSYLFLVGGVLFLVAGVVLLAAGTPVVGPTFLLVGVAFLAFASVSVSVTKDGLRVRSGPLGWPSVRFRLDRIDSAEAIDVKPMAAGGWGYRGSVRTFGRASWVLRAGPGIELHLRGGGRFIVTVDGAEEAAAVLNGLLTRAG
jgi:hypothetical protein